MAAKCRLLEVLVDHIWINVLHVLNLELNQFILESLALELDLREHFADLINDFDDEECDDAFLYIGCPDVLSFSLDSFKELFKGVEEVLRGLTLEFAKEIEDYT